jgi:hypothetical protein
MNHKVGGAWWSSDPRVIKITNLLSQPVSIGFAETELGDYYTVDLDTKVIAFVKPGAIQFVWLPAKKISKQHLLQMRLNNGDMYLLNLDSIGTKKSIFLTNNGIATAERERKYTANEPGIIRVAGHVPHHNELLQLNQQLFIVNNKLKQFKVKNHL